MQQFCIPRLALLRLLLSLYWCQKDSGNADTVTVTLTNAAGAVFSLFKVKNRWC